MMPLVGRVGRVGVTGGRARAPSLIGPGSAFDDAAWVKIGAGAGVLPVVTANAAAGPDGSMTADRVQLDLGGSNTTGDFSMLSIAVAGLTAGVSYAGRVFIRSRGAAVTVLCRHVGEASYSLFAVDGTWRPFDDTETALGASSSFDVGLRGGLGGGTVADLEMWGAELRRVG